ncbi:MAG: tyrosine-type recombinase/integrase [Bacillota bacterium]|nr:tyrosine-type recombinase/integrase [Bacillota bacterium]
MGKRKIPDVLTKEEEKKLLDVFNKRYLSSTRNKMMIQLMLKTGLRLSEIINLKWNNINLQIGKLKVVDGKGGKDRMVWFNNDTLDNLRKWRQRQSDEIGAANHVFTTSKGKQLEDNDVRKMVYRYAEKAGIQEEVEKHYHDEDGNELAETYKQKKVSPHTFRHTFATRFLRETNNLKVVQKALGHSDISTTQIYTHIVDTELENAMKSLT